MVTVYRKPGELGNKPRASGPNVAQSTLNRSEITEKPSKLQFWGIDYISKCITICKQNNNKSGGLLRFRLVGDIPNKLRLAQSRSTE